MERQGSLKLQAACLSDVQRLLRRLLLWGLQWLHGRGDPAEGTVRDALVDRGGDLALIQAHYLYLQTHLSAEHASFTDLGVGRALLQA